VHTKYYPIDTNVRTNCTHRYITCIACYNQMSRLARRLTLLAIPYTDPERVYRSKACTMWQQLTVNTCILQIGLRPRWSRHAYTSCFPWISVSCLWWLRMDGKLFCKRQFMKGCWKTGRIFFILIRPVFDLFTIKSQEPIVHVFWKDFRMAPVTKGIRQNQYIFICISICVSMCMHNVYI
jgi:hypothetical protein